MRTQHVALFGAFGAILPAIVQAYSKGTTMPHLRFEDWQYMALTLLYMGSAAVVAAIFPYPGDRTPWKAVTVGIGMPAVISSASTVVNSYINPAVGISRGDGEPLRGTFLEMLSLF